MDRATEIAVEELADRAAELLGNAKDYVLGDHSRPAKLDLALKKAKQAVTLLAAIKTLGQ